jgi:hypothetical protein
MFCGFGAANMLYRESGCDAVLCRPGTFSTYGHATLHSACRPCPISTEGETKSPPESAVLGRTTCTGVDFVHGDLNGDGILSSREILRMIYVDTLGRFWGERFQPWADMSVNECVLAGVTCIDGLIRQVDISTANLCSDGDRRPGPIEFCLGIPSELGLISTIEILRIESRQFLRGTIPTEIGQLTKLKGLDLANCSFLGTVPSEIFQLTSLVKLHLTNNMLSGSLPTTIGNLRKLKELMISRNSFSGTFPTEIGLMASLENVEGYDIYTSILFSCFSN